MGDKVIEKSIRNFVGSLESGNLEEALQFFDENCEWITNEGTFKGRTAIESYLKWMKSALEGIKFQDDGIGIITDHDKAVYQHIYKGTYSGRPVEVHSVCTYRFSGNKCTYHSTVSDRLATAHQAAGAFSGLAVDAVIKQVEKGLH